MSSLGKNVVVAILITFGITAAMAGAVGAFQAYYFQLIAPTSYTLNMSILIVAAVVLGGVGNVFGTIIGAIILGALKPLLETILGGEAILYQGLIYGLALVAMMIFRPQGILPEGAQVFRRKRSAYTSPRESLKGETSVSTPGEQPAVSSAAPHVGGWRFSCLRRG